MNDVLKIDESMRLQLGPGVRLKHDRERDCWTLMAPERVIVLDEIAHQVIVQIVESDGIVSAVIDQLSRDFDAPRKEIATDVLEMLQPFIDKQLLRRI